MGAENMIVKCERCGARNRIPKSRVGEKPICGKCHSRLSLDHPYPDHALNITDSNFPKEVLDFPGSVLVFLWSPSCGYCQRMLPIIDRLSSEYAGRVKFAKLITEQNPVTSSRYNVQGVPTLLFFRGGNQVDRTVGALPKEEIARRLNKL